MGSSPQARGTRRDPPRHQQNHGIIPAGAGNSSVRPVAGTPVWDHPRRRGELAGLSPYTATQTGSSPQARGTLLHRLVRTVPGGIIPAGAGNSSSLTARSTAAGDHPRRRGELARWWWCSRWLAGSSPQARGTHYSGSERESIPRIIPAGAGNSGITVPVRPMRRDHPRRRGELATQPDTVGDTVGSSPQARGTRRRLSLLARSSGIIPAGAGNSPGLCVRGSWVGDHPRRRGELGSELGCRGHPWGSSPQARGTRTMTSQPVPNRGIIPAGAGNS